MRLNNTLPPDMAARSGFPVRKPRKDLYLRSYTKGKTQGRIQCM